MLRFVVFLIFIFLMSVKSVVAQIDNYDWWLWSSIDIEKKLNKRWNTIAGFEYRWKDGVALTDQVRGSLGVDYKLHKYLKLGVAYTLIADKKQKKDIFLYRNRFTFNAMTSYKFKRFTASWRPRLQATFYDPTERDADELEDYRWVVLNRFGLNYNIRKFPLKPYIQFEIFNRIFSDLKPSYNQNRFSAGLDIGIGKKHELDIGYKQENELSEYKKERFDVVYAGYTFSF